MGACSGEQRSGSLPFFAFKWSIAQMLWGFILSLKKKMKRVDMRLKGCVIHTPHPDALTVSIVIL